MDTKTTNTNLKNELNGFLLVDKPVGPTSHDIVGVVRYKLTNADLSSFKTHEDNTNQKIPKRLTEQKKVRLKVGHAGTLDPLASGLMILGIGPATKKLGQLIGLDKIYEASILLGGYSSTDDSEGEKTIIDIKHPPSLATIKKIIAGFVGSQEQTPPIYSAKKQAGVRLYKLARAGKEISINPHSINIYNLDILDYKYPKLMLRIHCSSGTYVRSLARDIGKTLGTGGYIEQLRRTNIGKISLNKAINFNNIKTVEDILNTMQKTI